MAEYRKIMANAGLLYPQSRPETLFSDKPRLCPLCLGPFKPDFSYCYHCNQALTGDFKDELPDRISFLTYAGATDQSRLDFHQYKENLTPNPGRLRLESLVKDFISLHSKCMSNYAQLPVYSYIAVVPSGKAQRFSERSPLMSLLGVNTPKVISRKEPRSDSRDVGIDPDRYEILQDVRGRHVLLFEDTWVTGTNPLSSAVALKQAGAKYVSLVVLGRYLSPSKYPVHQQWLKENPVSPYDPRFCPVTRSFQCPKPLQ